MQGIDQIPSLSQETTHRLKHFAHLYMRYARLKISVERVDGNTIYVSAAQDWERGKRLSLAEVKTRAEDLFEGELSGRFEVLVNE